MLFLLTYTIRDIQYTTDSSGNSPLVGSYVSVIGKVSGIYPELRGFFIQDGECAWCGIFVYAGSSMPSLSLWDSVLIGGVVQEYRNMTEIVMSSINILGSGSPLNPLIVNISEIAESLEGVLVRVEGSVIDHWINRFGDFKLSNNRNYVYVMNSRRFSYIPFLGDSITVVGPIMQKYGDFYIMPRYDNDISPLKLIKYTAYFNRSTDTSVARYFKNPGNDTLRFVVSNIIGKARYNIDVLIYNLSSQIIVDSLISAKNRGVRVRVIYESSNYNTYIRQLEMSGIPTFTDSMRVDMGIMHIKAVIIDNRDNDTTNDIVLIGSYNFTTFADTSQVNSLTCIRSYRLGRVFLTEFNEMWGDTGDVPNPLNAKFGIQKTNNTPNVILEDSLSVWFPPPDTALDAFLRFIRQTNTQIHFGISIFTNDSVMFALRDVHYSGKLIAGIFDWDDWNNPSSKSWDMRSWTPPPRIIPYLSGYTFHDKFAIRDREAVELGSANWSYNAFFRNDEVLMLIYSKILSDQFFQYWYMRWLESDTTSPPLNLKQNLSEIKGCDTSQIYRVDGRRVIYKNLGFGIYFIRCEGKWKRILIK